jgi:ATP-dependent Clp protease adapter protein ClpS
MTLSTIYLLSLVIVAAYRIGLTSSFCLPPAFTRTSSPIILLAKGDGETGGAALAKPAVKIGQKTAMVTEQKSVVVQKRKAKTSEPVSRRDEEFQDAPMYKVMLIGDDDYDQAHVVERLCAIIEDMDENKAAGVFKQAQQGGKAMCGKVLSLIWEGHVCELWLCLSFVGSHDFFCFHPI